MGNLWEVHSPSEGIKSNNSYKPGRHELGWMANGHTPLKLPGKEHLGGQGHEHGRKVVAGTTGLRDILSPGTVVTLNLPGLEQPVPGT